jgi:regulator of protease activity HflC (stomatin/prohibitin superfamily)
MQIKALVALVLVCAIAFMSAYTVETGNVAVERTFGKVDHEEKGQGLNFKMPLLTNSIEFSAKEIAIDINDLTPKAADNLSLKDLDVSVFYRVPKDRVSELFVKYAAAAARGADGVYMPAYGLRTGSQDRQPATSQATRNPAVGGAGRIAGTAGKIRSGRLDHYSRCSPCAEHGSKY